MTSPSRKRRKSFPMLASKRAWSAKTKQPVSFGRGFHSAQNALPKPYPRYR